MWFKKPWTWKSHELNIYSCTCISEETMWKHQDPEVEEGKHEDFTSKNPVKTLKLLVIYKVW